MSTIISGWSSETDSARDEFNNLIDELWDSTGIKIDKDLIIRAYLLIFSDDIKFRITNFSLDNALEFKDNWVAIRASIVEAVDLISDFGYIERTLTSKNALLPIIYYLFKTNKTKQFTTKIKYKSDRALIKKWFHAVILKRIFGGQADMILKLIRDVIKVEVKKTLKHFLSMQ